MGLTDFVSWIQRANTHLEKMINMVDKFKALGITEEMFDKMSQLLVEAEANNSNLNLGRLKVLNK